MASYSLAGKRVWVAGHRGMVGQALVRRLAGESCEVVTITRSQADLRDPAAVSAWMERAAPQAIFMAAAKVGGILANDTRPAEFLYDNLMIEANITEAAYRGGVEKMLFLGSSCIYPKFAEQPIREDSLLTGPLEPTNEWYAVAKIAGIKLAQAYRRQFGCNFISAMPTNLYGPGDNFDLASGHVVPALMRKLDEAKAAGAETVELWGSGRPYREFMHVDDVADACIHLMTSYSDEAVVNIGTGEDLTIAELAETLARVVGWHGRFVYDASKPDGTPRKRLDVQRLAAAGWRARIRLEEGLASTYAWYLDHRAAPPPAAGDA